MGIIIFKMVTATIIFCNKEQIMYEMFPRHVVKGWDFKSLSWGMIGLNVLRIHIYQNPQKQTQFVG